MSLVVGELSAIMGADTTKFSRAMDQAKAKGTTTAQLIERRWMQMGSRLKTVGTNLSFALSAPIAGVGFAVSKAAVTWESAFTGVRKTVEGTPEQMRELADGIRGMAKEIPTSAKELAKYAEVAGQLGIQTDNILGFTRVIADLNETTNLMGEEGAAQLARFMNIMGTSQSDIDRVGSTVVDLGNNLATTEAEIVQMALRLASAGKIIGLTEARVLGLAGALSSVGLRAEMGGTAISKILTDMTKAVRGQTEELRLLASTANMTVEDFAALFKEDAARALIVFADGLKQMEEQGRNSFTVLEQLGFADRRVLDTMLRVSSAGDLMTDALKRGTNAWRENTALTDEAALRYGTTESRLKILSNRLKDVAVDIGEEVLPHVETLGQKVVNAAEAFNKLSDSTKSFVLAAGGIGLVAGPLAFLAGSLLQIAAWGIPAVIGLTGTLTATAGLIPALKGVTVATGTAALGTGVVGALGGLAFLIGFKLGPHLVNLIGKLFGVKDAMQELNDMFATAPELRQQELELLGDPDEYRRRVNMVNAALLKLRSEGRITQEQFLQMSLEPPKLMQTRFTDEQRTMVLEREAEILALLAERRAAHITKLEEEAAARRAALEAADTAAEVKRQEALNEQGERGVEAARELLGVTKDGLLTEAEKKKAEDDALQRKMDLAWWEHLVAKEVENREEVERKAKAILAENATLEERRQAALQLAKDVLTEYGLELAKIEEILRRINAKYDEMEDKQKKGINTMSEFGKQMRRNMQSTLANWLKTWDDGFKGLVRGFKEMLAAMLAELAASKLLDLLGQLFGSMFGSKAGGKADGGPVEGKSMGGLFQGAGTDTSDSNLVRLSNNEYVIRAAAVRKYGLGVFDALNQMAVPVMGRARGGLIGPAAASAAGGYSGITVNVDARGAEIGVEERIEQKLVDLEARTIRRSVAAVADANKRGGAFSKALR